MSNETMTVATTPFRIGQHEFDQVDYDQANDTLGLAKGTFGAYTRSEVDDPVGHFLGYAGDELVQVEIMWAREQLQRDGTVPVRDEHGRPIGDAGPAIRQLLGL